MVVYFFTDRLGGSATMAWLLTAAWIVVAVFVVEVLGRWVVDWMRVVRSG